MRTGVVATPHLALWSWKQGFRIQLDWNNASCLTFSALDILFDWDKSLLELDRLALGWPAVWQLFIYLFYLPYSFFGAFFLYVPLQVSEHYWTAHVFHSAGLAVVHTEEWEKVSGKVRKRVDQNSNLGESWTEIELEFPTNSNHPGQEKLGVKKKLWRRE